MTKYQILVLKLLMAILSNMTRVSPEDYNLIREANNAIRDATLGPDQL